MSRAAYTDPPGMGSWSQHPVVSLGQSRRLGTLQQGQQPKELHGFNPVVLATAI